MPWSDRLIVIARLQAESLKVSPEGFPSGSYNIANQGTVNFNC